MLHIYIKNKKLIFLKKVVAHLFYFKSIERIKIGLLNETNNLVLKGECSQNTLLAK